MLDVDIDIIKNIALEAGIAILEIYNSDFKVEYKQDQSPLTIADLKANEIICNSLQKYYPKIPIMSEENKQIDFSVRKNWDLYFCVDPIDGTKEFVNKNGEFTVNIALIYKNEPILGVVYSPVLNDLYYSKKGYGSFKNGLKLPFSNSGDIFKVVASKSHMNKETEDYLENLKKREKNLEIVSIGSSLKLCLVAENSAQLYPRLSPTMEWDTAAADAIVRESGKMTYDINTNKPLVYNKENLVNPYFEVR